MKYRVMINGEDGKRIRAERETYNVQASALSRENDFDAALNPKTVPAGSEYDETASDMLVRFGLEFRAVLVGDDCPTFCEDAAKDKDMDKLKRLAAQEPHPWQALPLYYFRQDTRSCLF